MASLAPFQIDSVLGAALSTFGRCFPAYVVAMIVGGLPVLIVQLAVSEHPNIRPDDAPIIFAIIGVGCLTSTLAACMVQASTLADLGGGKVGLWPALIRALLRFLPIMLALFLFGLAVGLGLLLAIVPGVTMGPLYGLVIGLTVLLFVLVPCIILGLMICLISPVMLAERIGPFRSYGRSAELTKGYRLRLFGLFVVVAVVMVILLFTLGLIMAFTLNPMAMAVTNYVAQSICSAFLSVLIVICYRSLKATAQFRNTA